MLNSIIEFLSNLTNITGGFGQLFYWSPLVLNLIGYTIFVWKRVQDDRKAVDKNEKYHSNFVTIGSLCSYLVYTALPVINCLALVFHIGPKMLDWIGIKFEWIFRIKLVKDTRAKD